MVQAFETRTMSPGETRGLFSEESVAVRNRLSGRLMQRLSGVNQASVHESCYYLNRTVSLRLDDNDICAFADRKASAVEKADRLSGIL